MSDVAIRVEKLGKRYRIGKAQVRHDTLRDALAASMRAPLKRFSSNGDHKKASDEWIWALKDISFEIARGEVVGIIGRNGAGKSTLLKILSRITEPTEGYVEMRGRVGTLLEVGTGFHGELSGRENIYLSGAILGMKKTEIDRKFDEIVAFAEVDKFIDTPVKHYSSGMHVRLAFAVAAHLEPEILLVDEVLAVGDAAFQKKCLGKMGDVAQEGRTVLFVSHNMAAMQSICERGILLVEGQVKKRGSIESVIQAYSDQLQPVSGIRDLSEVKSRRGSGQAKLLSCTVLSEGEDPIAQVRSGYPLRIQVSFIAPEIADGSYLAVQIYRFDNVPIFALLSSQAGIVLAKSDLVQRLQVEIPRLTLFPSFYFIKLGLNDPNHHLYDFVDPALSFTVIPNIDSHPVFNNPRSGVIDITTKWSKLEEKV